MRRWGILFALVAALTAAGVVSTSRAHATSYGYVYFVAPSWWGWCPYSSVTAVSWFNTGISQGGDAGDNIVYAKVALNTRNTVTLQVQCSRTVPEGNVIQSITPTRNGETYWFGYPDGNYHN